MPLKESGKHWKHQNHILHALVDKRCHKRPNERTDIRAPEADPEI